MLLPQLCIKSLSGPDCYVPPAPEAIITKTNVALMSGKKMFPEKQIALENRRKVSVVRNLKLKLDIPDPEIQIFTTLSPSFS